jgi:hypothetical protein
MTDEKDRKAKPLSAGKNAILNDEKATANAKHDRHDTDTGGTSLGDALTLGGGQQSTPYQLATQADAIAKQTKRGKI